MQMDNCVVSISVVITKINIISTFEQMIDTILEGTNCEKMSRIGYFPLYSYTYKGGNEDIIKFSKELTLFSTWCKNEDVISSLSYEIEEEDDE